jgi:hypothetical protein
MRACELSIVDLMKQSAQQQAEAEAQEIKKRDAAQAEMDSIHLSTVEKVRFKLLHKCFELLWSLLMPFGWVYVLYVGHIDKNMKPL